jgi:hypothetical protein
MTDIPNLETFAIQFLKLVQIVEQVDIQKEVDVDVWVSGNLAMADAKGEAQAFGADTLAETLALTSTTVVQGLFSDSSSHAQSTSATPNADWHIG